MNGEECTADSVCVDRREHRGPGAASATSSRRVRPRLDDPSPGTVTSLPPEMPPGSIDAANFTLMPLTDQQKGVAHLTVDVALRYDEAPARVDLLETALSRLLPALPVICGRVVLVDNSDDAESDGSTDRDGRGEIMLCVPRLDGGSTPPEWAYVPLTREVRVIERHSQCDNGCDGDGPPVARAFPFPRDGFAPDSMFDMADRCVPAKGFDRSKWSDDHADLTDGSDEALGDPVTRIKVTTLFEERNEDGEGGETVAGQVQSPRFSCQVIALSMCHCIVDAKAVSDFMVAWARLYRDECRREGSNCCASGSWKGGRDDGSWRGVTGRNATFRHPIFDMDRAPTSGDEVPQVWKDLLPKQDGTSGSPFASSTPSESSTDSREVTCTVYHRSDEDIDLLKRALMSKHKVEGHLPSPPFLSSNDALLGEVCVKCDITSVMLCMNWRPVLDLNRYFGYAIIFLYLTFPVAIDAVATTRRILGHKGVGDEYVPGVANDPEFVRWKIRNEWRHGRTSLIWNSWDNVFALRGRVQTQASANRASRSSAASVAVMECSPVDMMMSERMCRLRVGVARKRNVTYAIVFPTVSGVRVYFFGDRSLGNTLASQPSTSAFLR